MADKKLTCRVLTPERTFLDAQAEFIAIPAHDGEIGILPGRAPLLCRLGSGILRLDGPNGEQKLFIDSGFAEVLHNRVSVLTEGAAKPEDVDAAAEEKALEEARQRTAHTELEMEARRRDIARAKGKLKLVGKA